MGKTYMRTLVRVRMTDSIIECFMILILSFLLCCVQGSLIVFENSLTVDSDKFLVCFSSLYSMWSFIWSSFRFKSHFRLNWTQNYQRKCISLLEEIKTEQNIYPRWKLKLSNLGESCHQKYPNLKIFKIQTRIWRRSWSYNIFTFNFNQIILRHRFLLRSYSFRRSHLFQCMLQGFKMRKPNSFAAGL